jgi:hypothetical protein
MLRRLWNTLNAAVSLFMDREFRIQFSELLHAAEVLRQYGGLRKAADFIMKRGQEISQKAMEKKDVERGVALHQDTIRTEQRRRKLLKDMEALLTTARQMLNKLAGLRYWDDDASRLYDETEKECKEIEQHINDLKNAAINLDDPRLAKLSSRW